MFLDHRGFTLGEVLASLIALGIIALTVQSLILFANNFLNQQEATLSSLEEQVFFSNMLCSKFQRPVFAEYDPSRSFVYNPDSSGESYKKRSDTRPDPKEDPAVFSVPLLDKSKPISGKIEISVTDHPAVKTFLKDNLTIGTGPNDKSKVLRAHIDDEANTFNNLDGETGNHNYYSQFYDIYTDDHTLPTFIVRQTEGNNVLGTISDGFIYASRCIKNEENKNNAGSFIEIEGKSPKYSIIDSTDKDMSEEEIKATALYVLEQRWRPFYFPSGSKNKVICCDIDQYLASSANAIKLDSSGNPPSNCKTLEKYTPIIYVISISSGNADDSAVENDVWGNKSLEGYVQNKSGDFSGHADCETTPPSNKVELNLNCKNIVKADYFKNLGKKIVHPVAFQQIEELPLVKKDRVNTWAYGFIASTFSNPFYKEFKVLSIENKCHTSMPIGFCGKVMPGKDLSVNLLQNGKSAADYLITRARHCPFRYVTMENSASPMPLGLDRVE